jgi:pimeloyl-ACP methyl ester carboxylesterase
MRIGADGDAADLLKRCPRGNLVLPRPPSGECRPKRCPDERGLAPVTQEVTTSCIRLSCVRFPFALVMTLVASGLATAADVSGLVDIGGGRKMYLACAGVGSPTVVLISGKGNGAADWKMVLDPTDPAHDADFDAVAWGKGDLHESESAVFPMVSRWTRVCAYDRPGTRLDGADLSTPIAQPHRADQAADDLHRLLHAAGEFGPYVLVAHSYGGVIATLFARTWPAEVAGLVMVDAATQLMERIASPAALAKWDEVNRSSSPGAPEAVMLIDAFAKIDAAAPQRALPSVVLSSDKPWQPPSATKESQKAAGVTFADWGASEGLLAASLNAKHVAKTYSGHAIYAYSPQLVIDAIHEVVDAARGEASRVKP